MSSTNRWPVSIENIRGSVLPLAVPRTTKTIVVPLRDLNADERVVCYAAGLARRIKARVRLVHLRDASLRTAASDVLMIDDGKQMEFRLRSSEYVDAILRRCSEATNVDISVSTRNGSNLASALKDECTTGNELVVFQREDRAEWRQWWLNRELRELLHQPVPVLILPPAVSSSAANRGDEAKRVLISLTDDTAVTGIVRLAVDFAGTDAEYNLLRVLPMGLLTSFQNRPRLYSEAASNRNRAWFALRRSRAQIEQRGATADAHIVFDAIAAGRAIVSQAITRGADLVVLGRQPPALLPFQHCAWKHVALNSAVPVLLGPDRYSEELRGLRL